MPRKNVAHLIRLIIKSNEHVTIHTYFSHHQSIYLHSIILIFNGRYCCFFCITTKLNEKERWTLCKI